MKIIEISPSSEIRIATNGYCIKYMHKTCIILKYMHEIYFTSTENTKLSILIKLLSKELSKYTNVTNILHSPN